MSFRKKALEDTRVKQLVKLLDSSSYKLPTRALIEELKTLHATRYVRILTRQEVMHHQQSKIIRAQLQNQAHRSRAVEIKMGCFDTHAELNKHVRALKKYLALRYANYFQGVAVRQRDLAIDYIMEPANKVLSDLDNVCKIADLLIGDIDEAKWAIQGVLKTLELSTRPERNI
jgi:hypothetical protein